MKYLLSILFLLFSAQIIQAQDSAAEKAKLMDYAKAHKFKKKKISFMKYSKDMV